MTSLKRAVIGITLGIALGWYFKAPINETKSQGTVSEEIAEVRTHFDEILLHEKEGLALAIYKDGELIADLWGGYAERDALRLWERDTMSVVFSTTKAIGALVIAVLVSRHQLQYDHLVTKYWPEFGQHGKENVTIQWIVEHKAGLIKFGGDIELNKGNDHKYISKLIEQSEPVWPPGTAVGYHALTYGWLIDQIVRRADPKKRGIGDFYREEIQPLMKDKDFYIGLPRDLHARMARLVQPTTAEFVKAVIFNPHFVVFGIHSTLHHFHYMGLMGISGSYPKWMTVVDSEMPYNNPRVREIENVAALGIGTARGLAGIAATIMQNNLISASVWKKLSKPAEYVTDKVAYLTSHRGYGFFYEPHPIRKGDFVLTHMGHGGQRFILDPTTKISIAMIRNGLTWDMNIHKFTDRIAQVVFQRLGKR